MKIIHGSVYTPDFRFEKKSVSVRNGRFLGFSDEKSENSPEMDCVSGRSAADKNMEEEIIDASGCYVCPSGWKDTE